MTCSSTSLECTDSNQITYYGYAIFSTVLALWLLQDVVSCIKLLLLALEKKNIDFLFTSGFVFVITVLSAWTSIYYNSAIATKNTELIVNTVILLFVVELDEKLYELAETINESLVSGIEKRMNENNNSTKDLLLKNWSQIPSNSFKSVKGGIRKGYHSLRKKPFKKHTKKYTNDEKNQSEEISLMQYLTPLHHPINTTDGTSVVNEKDIKVTSTVDDIEKNKSEVFSLSKSDIKPKRITSTTFYPSEAEVENLYCNIATEKEGNDIKKSVNNIDRNYSVLLKEQLRSYLEDISVHDEGKVEDGDDESLYDNNNDVEKNEVEVVSVSNSNLSSSPFEYLIDEDVAVVSQDEEEEKESKDIEIDTNTLADDYIEKVEHRVIVSIKKSNVPLEVHIEEEEEDLLSEDEVSSIVEESESENDTESQNQRRTPVSVETDRKECDTVKHSNKGDRSQTSSSFVQY